MVIEVARDGTLKWHFYRKAYRKARWRRAAQRDLDDFFRFRETHPGTSGLVIIR